MRPTISILLSVLVALFVPALVSAGDTEPNEEATYLKNVRQLTYDGLRAGEGYFSPDGNYLMVQMVQRPYTYSLQEDDFPKKVEIWNLDGEQVYLVADLPLRDQVPISFGSVSTGPRSYSWRSDVAATLTWVEALDGGDGGVEAEERDRIFTLDAPFDGEPRRWAKLENRYGGIYWARDDLALVSGWWWKTRNIKVWHVAPEHRDREQRGQIAGAAAHIENPVAGSNAKHAHSRTFPSVLDAEAEQ